MSYDTEERLSATLRGIVEDRPYAPDLDQIESRGRKLRHRRLAWRATAGTGLVAAIAAIAVATTGTGTPAPTSHLAGPKPAETSNATSPSTGNAALVRLAGYLTTSQPPAGDATLLLRDQVSTNGHKIDVWDLHADNGDYYFAKTRGALPAQVTGRHTSGQVDKAALQKAVAAAEYAAKGDLNEARERMALAYEPKNPLVKPTHLDAPGVPESLSPNTRKKLAKLGQSQSPEINSTDNWVWQNSMTALIAGAGSPSVRAGVLRLLGQMQEIKVTQGTIDGQPVLTLAAGSMASGNGTESLTINADTGLPIKDVMTGLTVNYTVTRVTLADVAAGRF